ncbi:MAG TPA: phosphatidylserine decarboxylase [Vicinamibacterales bacterium]|jgi:phosphatidylserine decarboxylase|nr:phosphatidylserine decarboxylase [Vicinamibacterales bacterium]
MKIDPAGVPFIVGALALGVIAGVLVSWTLVVPGVALAAIFLFFFRDPDRRPLAGSHLVLSPADGRVLVAGAAEPGVAPAGEWKQISIFLSPMNVHVNRIPASGRVTQVLYKRGRFLPAYHAHAAAANERSEVWIDHDGQPIVARQVVGVLARRVVCRLQPGAEVRAGDRYGVMKFGSRMDVFLPVTAEIRVQIGDEVRAAESLIAVLH